MFKNVQIFVTVGLYELVIMLCYSDATLIEN